MFLKAAAFSLLTSIVVDAGGKGPAVGKGAGYNTPEPGNLCSDDIHNLIRIAPSATGLDIGKCLIFLHFT